MAALEEQKTSLNIPSVFMVMDDIGVTNMKKARTIQKSQRPSHKVN